VSVAALISIGSPLQIHGGSDGEGTFAELQSHPTGNTVIVVGRAIRSSVSYQRRRFNQVLEVGGCSSIEGLMDRQAERELNPFLNWQPMERPDLMLCDLLVKGHIQVEQLRASPVAVMRV